MHNIDTNWKRGRRGDEKRRKIFKILPFTKFEGEEGKWRFQSAPWIISLGGNSGGSGGKSEIGESKRTKLDSRGGRGTSRKHRRIKLPFHSEGLSGRARGRTPNPRRRHQGNKRSSISTEFMGVNGSREDWGEKINWNVRKWILRREGFSTLGLEKRRGLEEGKKKAEKTSKFR